MALAGTLTSRTKVRALRNMNPQAGGGGAAGRGAVQVVHDRSLTCEFAIPADLAARIRAENARRLALYQERQLSQRSAEEEIPEGLERIDVYVDRAAGGGAGAATAVAAAAGSEPLTLPHSAESAPAATSEASLASASSAVAGADKAQGAAAVQAASRYVDIEEDPIDDDGWAQTADPGDAPDAAMLAAINTFGAHRGGDVRGGSADIAKAAVADASRTAAVASSSDDAGEEQAQRGGATSTSTEPLAADDAAAAAAAAVADEEPVLVLDAGAILAEGADLTPEQVREFQDGIGSSLARDCDAACESLFDNFAEVSEPYPSAASGGAGPFRHLRHTLRPWFRDSRHGVARLPKLSAFGLEILSGTHDVYVLQCVIRRMHANRLACALLPHASSSSSSSSSSSPRRLGRASTPRKGTARGTAAG